MTNPTLLPFDLIQEAAESLTDLRVKSQLLAELAQSQLFLEQFDAALRTLAAIPSSLERRVALLTADYQHFPPEKIGALVQLLESDPRTQFIAGNLALAMLEALLDSGVLTQEEFDRKKEMLPSIGGLAAPKL